MPLSDYVPDTNERNFFSHYRNVLGVPIRRRVIIAVLTVFILILIFVCALMFSKYRRDSGKTPKTSFAPYVSLIDSLNTSVDPCSNFYNFTCGSWSKNELVSKQDDDSVTTFSILESYVTEQKRTIFENSKVSKKHPRVVNDAIAFYKMCIARNSTDPTSDVKYLLYYFDQMMKGWPILNLEKWDDKNFDWFKVSAFLLKTLHFNTIVSVGSIIDANDTSRKMIYIRPPQFQGYQPIDLEFSSSMLFAALTSIKHTLIDSSNIYDTIIELQKTEKKWFQNFQQLPSFNETSGIKMSIKELKEQIPNFKWLSFIQLIMNDTLNEIGEGVSMEDQVLVFNLDTLKNIFTGFHIETFSNLELANLFGWFVVQNIWYFIPGLLWQYSQLTYYSVEEFKVLQRDKCFEAVFQWYECSIDYLYVKNSSHSGVSDGKVIVHYIKKVFKDLLQNSDWMEDSTKMAALDKLSSMQSIIGFPSYLQNKAEYSEMYKGFPKLTTSLIETYFKILSYYTSAFVKEFKDPKNKFYIPERSITDVSAYYDLQRNTFVFPLSMYDRPFYHLNGPWYFNFGAIGTIIGHEIMHGFDSTGCQRGPYGNLHNWWSNETAVEYKQRSKCFAEQYAAHRHLNKSVSKVVDTLDEDIADNEGLKIAYLAYKMWEKDNGPEQTTLKNYSSDQLFFMSFGSLWCAKESPSRQPSKSGKQHSDRYMRVNQVVSNSGHFSSLFHCSSFAPMNPERKCSIW